MKTEITQYLTFSISIAVISWLVGMIFTSLIKKTSYYNKISNLNYIKSDKLNKIIGLNIFKWIVKNTFFKYLNQKLKLNNKIEVSELVVLRQEMTFSEISHLAGFWFVVIFAIEKCIQGRYFFGLIIMIVNTLLNLYPSLLQQINKRRIDRLLTIVKRQNQRNNN